MCSTTILHTELRDQVELLLLVFASLIISLSDGFKFDASLIFVIHRVFWGLKVLCAISWFFLFEKIAIWVSIDVRKIENEPHRKVKFRRLWASPKVT